MALTKLEENLNTIENLPDSPTLESTELKKKFDESSIKIKDFINETLTTEIDNILTKIKKDINNMNFLILNLLKLSKFDTNTIKYEVKKYKVDNIIREVINNLSYLSENHEDLFDLIDYRWGLILETFNSSPKINKKVKI